jgi:hypothetical protein
MAVAATPAPWSHSPPPRGESTLSVPSGVICPRPPRSAAPPALSCAPHGGTRGGEEEDYRGVGARGTSSRGGLLGRGGAAHDRGEPEGRHGGRSRRQSPRPGPARGARAPAGAAPRRGSARACAAVCGGMAGGAPTGRYRYWSHCALVVLPTEALQPHLPLRLPRRAWRCRRALVGVEVVLHPAPRPRPRRAPPRPRPGSAPRFRRCCSCLCRHPRRPRCCHCCRRCRLQPRRLGLTPPKAAAWCARPQPRPRPRPRPAPYPRPRPRPRRRATAQTRCARRRDSRGALQTDGARRRATPRPAAAAAERVPPRRATRPRAATRRGARGRRRARVLGGRRRR